MFWDSPQSTATSPKLRRTYRFCRYVAGHTQSCNGKVANRNVRGVLVRGDGEWSLNDGHILNFRGVRVALGTSYNPGEGNRRASRKRNGAPKTVRAPCTGADEA